MVATQTPDEPDLLRMLERVAARLGGPGEEAAALLPARTAGGDVVVALWSGADGTRCSLLDMEGNQLDDRAAAREALSLTAMLETLEDHSRPEPLLELAERAARWATEAARQAPQPVLQLAHSAAEAACALAASGRSTDAPRLARVELVDAIVTLARTCETVWNDFAKAADTWLSTTPGDTQAGDLRSQLWDLLADAARSSIATPVDGVAVAGRAAGEALADEVLCNWPEV